MLAPSTDLRELEELYALAKRGVVGRSGREGSIVTLYVNCQLYRDNAS